MGQIKVVFAALFFVVFSFSTMANAQEFMGLDELRTLLDKSPSRTIQAQFKSVSRGVKIETYDITLRGVVREPGLEFIPFVMSDKIVAGMSGSPVYVNNKLLGALAYQLNSPDRLQDYHWGGISPAVHMRDDVESGRNKSRTVSRFTYQGMDFVPIATGNRVISESFFEMIKSGNDEKLISDLKSLAGNKFIISTKQSGQIESSLGSVGKISLKAGMPIVVDLIEWMDEKGQTTTVSAMGTITYIDDKGKVYAFGHPFLNSKNVVYSFRTAEVVGSIFQDRSYKLTGRQSDVLGVITFDSTYGIYGATSFDDLSKLHRFDLEFKVNGKPLHKFGIKVADSILTPLLSWVAFSMIGDMGGAPMSEEASVTQLDVKVGLQDHGTLVWKELFASSATKFGPSTIYTSSYEAASGAFFSGIYGLLFNNKHGLNISNVSISADFIRGKSQVFKLGAYKFPNKVVWGQDPILEILFVSQDNVMAIVKKVSLKVDWTKVEKPIYTRETLDTGKDVEKVVQGLLRVEGPTSFLNYLSNSERQKFMPEYFLGSEDFLANLSSRLAITSQKVFVRTFLKSRSGLFDEAIANAKDIMPQDVPAADNTGWHVISGGLKERKTTVKDEGMVIFYTDLPQIPSGYVIDPRMQEIFNFEVVLE